MSERIESEINDDIEDFVTNTGLTNNELRELRGILNVKGNTGEEKIRFLEVVRDHWKEEANKEKTNGNDMKSKLYDAIARTADLKIDEIRLRLNQQPEGERMKEMVEEKAEVNDLTRFESSRSGRERT